MKITKKQAWQILSNTENTLLGASGTHTLEQIISKLQVFGGDTFNNARTANYSNPYRIEFSDGSMLKIYDFNKAYKYGDYLVLEKDNEHIVYQTF